MLDTTNSEPNTAETRTRRRKILYLGLIATIVILAIYAVSVSLTAGNVSSSSSHSTQVTGVVSGSPLVGKKAPEFELTTVKSASETVSLKTFIGHPLVLNFFASWCVPCRTELPEFAKLAKAEAGRVQFLGVDENDTRGPGLSLINATGVTYPAVFDGSVSLAQPYHLIGLPTTFFINSQGVVVKAIAGQISLATLKSGIASISQS